MFIKDVVMDGFKCYTDTVTLKGIDRYFTAITGMNGSGKSNILDAIIFALDLSSSRFMRVANLKELINIGRKECTVTVVFDNSEKNKSPSGYESYETIEITRSLDTEGRSKYRLNGHSSTKGSIESLCKNMGITDDFVVMQGQITKIVNMRSADLRTMIEETAGTKSYSIERQKSIEMLTKKEVLLKEVREHLKRTISPFFEQLKREKQLYEEGRNFEENREGYAAELRGLETLQARRELSSGAEEMRRIVTQLYEEQQRLDEVVKKIEEAGKLQTGNTYELSSKIANERMKLEDLEAQNPAEQIAEKEAEYSRLLTDLKRLGKGNLAELKAKEEVLARDLVAGTGSEKVSELESSRNAVQKREIELSVVSSELDEKYRQTGIDAGFDIGEAVKRNRLGTVRCKELEEEISAMRGKLHCPVVNGYYQDGVYGTVDENFEMVDEKYKEAILAVLGGRAKFIICENDEIASKLIQSSDRKISCIPLNKITYSEPRRLSYACVNVLDTIRFDPRLSRAFKHIFSMFYVFVDKKQAAACCFECNVVCVTCDGTVYDPKGTLTGGKVTFKGEVTRMRDIIARENELRAIRETLQHPDAISALRDIEGLLEKKEALQQQIGSLRMKIETLQDMCASKIDVKRELERVRDSIVVASKESKQREDTRMAIDRVERELMGLAAEKNEILNKVELTKAMLLQLQTQQRGAEIEENSRKVSIRMVEGLEEERRALIKSTVMHTSRIAALQDELKAMAVEDENRLNRTGEMVSKEVARFAVRKFEIDLSVLNYPVYERVDEKAMQARMAALRESLTKKRVFTSMDPASFELLERHVATVQDLEDKISKLESDRTEIYKSMEKLNEISVGENRRAFEHVNKALRVFLGYFLADTDIHITSDFEIRVKIGNWKNSLGELSGGQKSLIALCLMFSMLTFKPAPFYIFDEIDAALDLNYTQAIGEIIQKEFRGAQFVVISLKNNMFDNANKIFKVFVQNHRSKVVQIK